MSDLDRTRALWVLSLATLFSMSVWFTSNALAPVLLTEMGLSSAELAWLTIAVQFGFVAGTLLISITNLSDLVNTRRLFATCAMLAGITNLVMVVASRFEQLLFLRVLTGLFLGGVYPASMKILSGWYEKGRGYALGVLVGALTLGSGLPHLLRSIFLANWQYTVYTRSTLAGMAGVIALSLVKDGPHDVPARRFDPRFVSGIIRERGPRLALLGYLGHMWELYAAWSWAPIFLSYVMGTETLAGMSVASLLAFLVFAMGAASCVIGGVQAERRGRTLVTSVAMLVSGVCSVSIGFLIQVPWPILWILSLVWGASLVADSAQFSTAMTELTEPEYRGTALAFQTGLGFS
jgi:MFS family permease